MRYLRTNTATRITVGPFFDKGDGVTPETAITVTSCKLTFIVDTAGVPTLILDTAPTASGGNNDMVHVTNDDAGFYDLELTAADTNYLGRAMLAITDAATHCPVFHEFMILPAMIYDSMILGTDVLQADTTQWLGTACAAPSVAGVPEVDLTHVAGATTNVSALATNVDAILTDTAVIGTTGQGLTSLATQASVNTVDDFIDTEIADIQARLPAALTANGNMKCSLMEIISTVLTETAGQIAAAFKQFFDVASPTGTMKAITNVVTATNLTTNNDKTGYSISGTKTTLDALNDISTAQVNTEVDTALADANLDHLVGTATGIPAIVSGTYIDQIMDDGTAVYDRTTDSLQAIRDAGGGSTDWSAGEKEQIRQALGVDGTKTATASGDINLIRAKAGAILSKVL